MKNIIKPFCIKEDVGSNIPLSKLSIMNEHLCKNLAKGLKGTLDVSDLDINELLSKSSNIIDSNYLENTTLDNITQTIFDIIQEHIKDEKLQKIYCNKLTGYRYVDRVCDIRTNRYTRWITNDKLHNGGNAVNIRIGDDSIYILCKTPSKNYPYITCNYNNVLLFQKLTEEESLLLIANKMIK